MPQAIVANQQSALTLMVHLRIFLSSPGDVAEERQLARDAIAELQREPQFEAAKLEAVSWDDPHGRTPLVTQLDPQTAVERGLPKPSECAVVVGIFWARMGSPLPIEKYKKADGSAYLSGTEYELEDAFVAKLGPDVLLYRRSDEPHWGARDPDRKDKEEQFARIEDYIAWLKIAHRFVDEYPDPSGFKERLKNDLRKVLARRLKAAPIVGRYPATPAAIGNAPTAARPPDAFLSHTRFDDRQGAITAFGRHLSYAVREVTGEPFEIFQNVDDIEIGPRWSEIPTEGRLFIPILTPSYFLSPACRNELEKFLRIEERTGRRDLLWPIYYIRCPMLEDREPREADDLAIAINQRQWWDWRELRHSSFRNIKVRRRIESLAVEIAKARQTRVMPRARHAARPGVDQKDVDVHVPADAERAAEQAPRLVEERPRRFASEALRREAEGEAAAKRLADEEARPRAEKPPEPGSSVAIRSRSDEGMTAGARIFLAHAREDKPQVRKLYDDLKARGLDPWLDEMDLMPGQIWKIEIPKAIRQAGIFLACLSSRSVEKVGYIQNEFRLALSVFGERPPGSIYLIPARLDECAVPDLQIPDRGLSLQDIQWVDLWQEGGLDRLAKSIERALGVVPSNAIPALERLAEQRAEQARQGPVKPAAAKLWAGIDPRVGMVFRDIDVSWCPEMVVVPPGEFMMGSTAAERQWASTQGAGGHVRVEKPQHRVRIALPFAVGRYPVTFDEFDQFCDGTGRKTLPDDGWGRGPQAGNQCI
jgi:TIR domain/Sulfatase-modifying factor enzyme 1